MRMRRCHVMQIAREAQRIENQKRRKENERPAKINFVVRLVRRLGLVRSDNNRSV